MAVVSEEEQARLESWEFDTLDQDPESLIWHVLQMFLNLSLIWNGDDLKDPAVKGNCFCTVTVMTTFLRKVWQMLSLDS